MKALENTRVMSSDASRVGITMNKYPHKIDENFGQSLPENRILPENDSICSDSEFGKFLFTFSLLPMFLSNSKLDKNLTEKTTD